MERLGPSDYQSVLDFVRQIHAIQRMDDFPRRAMAGVSHLIESDMLTYNEIDTRRQRAFTVQEPAGAIGAAHIATFERLAYQHPLINHYARTRESQPRKVSDFLSLTEFRRLDLYQEFFRAVGINYQMAVTIPSSNGLVIGIALNRARRDFSERDRSVHDLVRPHLVQAYRNIAERGALRERAEAAEQARACNRMPRRFSSCRIEWLSADGMTPSRHAAARKLSRLANRPIQPPVFARATVAAAFTGSVL